MGRPVVHWELNSPNPEQLATFFKAVFDWDIQHIPEANYRLVTPGGDGGIGGGIAQPEAGQTPPQTMFYIDVDDLAAYGRKITAAGGTMILEGQEVPGMGTLSLFLDPDGRMLGLWKAAASVS